MQVRIVSCLLLLGAVSAATWRARLADKPAELSHKEGCYVKEMHDVIPFGSEVTPAGECYRVECSRHVLYYDTCGVASTDDPQCYVGEEDLKKPYPDCCPTVQCEVNNNLS